MQIMSNKDRKDFGDYRIFLYSLPKELRDCPKDTKSLRRLLEKVVAMKERFALPRMEEVEAATLRKAEDELIARIQVLTAEKAEKTKKARA